MVWCALMLTNSSHILLIASAAVLIEHGTWKIWKLNGAYALDPVRCMIDPFLTHQRNLTLLNFIQRLFCGFPKWEDSCRDQLVRRHWLVFARFQSLRGHTLPKHNASHHFRKCHSSSDICSQRHCCTFGNVDGLCPNYQHEKLFASGVASAWQ
jgi:hypothetical protein